MPPKWIDAGRNNLSYGGAPRVPQAPGAPSISPPPSIAKSVTPVDPAKARPGIRIPPAAVPPLAATGRSVYRTATQPAAQPPAPRAPVDPAATPAGVTPRVPEPFPTGQAAYDRWVKNPASAVNNAAMGTEMAAGGSWLAGQGLRAVGSKAAPALINGSNGVLGWASPLSRYSSYALPAVAAGDAGIKLWNNRNDTAGSTARMAQSNADNSTVGGYLGNAPMSALRNFGQLATGDGTPLFEMADATLGGINDAGRGVQQAVRGSTLDSALQSRQAVADQVTSKAMQTGSATQQQLRDATAYAQRQREAEMQSRNWQPWLWGMSQ